MTSYVTPKKGVEYIFYVGLVSQSTGQFQVNPTIASGDWKISKDGGAFANLATLPAVTPAGGRAVKVTLSSTEMTADNVMVQGVDAAGDEWDEITALIQTTASQIDDLATAAALATVQADTDNIQTRLPAALSGDGFMKVDLLSIGDELVSGNNATLNLKHLSISNNAGDAISAVSTAVNGKGAAFVGSGGSPGISVDGGETGNGFDINGAVGINVQGLLYQGVLLWGQERGIQINGEDNEALYIETFGTNKDAAAFVGTGTGKSINATQDIALPSGDLDDQLQAIDNYIDTEIAALPAAVWASGTRTLTSFGTLVADIWALAIETGYTAKQSMRLMLSALAGKLSGAATTTVTIRSATDAKDRIVATVDESGNRSAVTHDVSD